MSVELQKVENPTTTFKRYYARDERTLTGTFRGPPDPERMAFPVLGTKPQPEVRALKAPLTVGEADPATRELEAVGWMRSNYHPFHTIWEYVAGRIFPSIKAYDQLLTREEALVAHTRSNAYLLFMEKELGTLEAGKLADLVVLDRDYMTVPADDILNIKPVMTMTGGKIVYEAK